MTVSVIYDPAYLKHDTGHHPENAHRLKVVLESLSSSDLSKRIPMVKPMAAKVEDVVRCHRPEMVEDIKQLCEHGAPSIDVDTHISRESYDVALLAAGAATGAVDMVMKQEGARVFGLVRPPGHHARLESAMGFCLFNNAAIGARYAQAKYGVEKVLIIDWDVHHGNGTQEIFWTDPSVFYFSTHQYPFYPGTGSANERGAGKGEGYTLNVPLRAGTSGRDHREAFSEGLKVIERSFHPDLIVISAGFDSRRGDLLGGLLLDDADFGEMTKDVLRLAEKYSKGRVIGLLEGGYNLELLGGSVLSHLSALM